MSSPSNARTTLLTIERPGNPSVFGPDVVAAARVLIDRYPPGQARSALLPMLHLVQSEEGYITTDGIAFCARELDLTHAQVAAVVTFYTMYKRRPTGEYLVSVCTNTLCGLLGGDDIYATLSDILGVGMNGTTEDGAITLEHAECLAACDYAPVVTVNYEFFDNQTSESALELVNRLRTGERPLPSRGAPLCSFREISRQIAGFVDERPAGIEAVTVGPPTAAGVALAAERGERAADYPKQDGTGGGRSAEANAPTANGSGGAPAYGTGKNKGGAQESSANDAPLSTAASDPANETKPAGQKETGT